MISTNITPFGRARERGGEAAVVAMRRELPRRWVRKCFSAARWWERVNWRRQRHAVVAKRSARSVAGVPYERLEDFGAGV